MFLGPRGWVGGRCRCTVLLPVRGSLGCVQLPFLLWGGARVRFRRQPALDAWTLLLDAGVPATGSWGGACFWGDAGWPTTGSWDGARWSRLASCAPPSPISLTGYSCPRCQEAVAAGPPRGTWVPIASFAGQAWPGTLVHDDGQCLLRWMGQLLLSTALGGWGWWCWELVPSPPLWGSGWRGGVGCWPRHFHLGCRVEDAPPLWVSEGITLCPLTVSTRLVPHTIVSP